MLYKEWQTVKVKLLIWLAVYLLLAGVFIIEHGGFELNHDFSVPLFEQWQGVSALVMTMIAALAGIDLVAYERDNTTLSFLLTKPISRTQIYLSKLGLNIVGLAAVFLPFNFLMLAIDQNHPTGISDLGRKSEACLQYVQEECFHQIQATALSSDIWQSIGIISLIFLFGLSIVCLTGLISIFAHNYMQALLFSVPALLSFVGIVAASVIRVGPSGITGTAYFYSGTAITPLLLVWLGATFFCGGLLAFRRKEF